MQTILLFALPEEYGDFARVTGPWQLARRKPFRCFHRTDRFRNLVLVETGMGEKQALAALHWLLSRARPDLVIGAGFAGSLSEQLTVGDVCLGEVILSLGEGHPVECHPGVCAPPPEGKPPVTLVLKSCAEIASKMMPAGCQFRLHHARIVTVPRPQPKPLLSQRYADRASVVDMESYGAARCCYENGVPFLGLRAVSDALWDAIDFDPTSLCDGRGRVRIPRVLVSVMRAPRLIGSYHRSWKRSRSAARSLGRVLAGLIRLPAEELDTVAKSISYCVR